jgi:hypothetical protein
MNRDQQTYIRYLRLVLGDGMRKADDIVNPFSVMLAQGYRWEDDDTLEAIIATDELSEIAEQVHSLLKDFLGPLLRRKAALTKSERDRLVGAEKGIAKGIKFLDSIEMSEVIELRREWESTGRGRAAIATTMPALAPLARTPSKEETHETYFLLRFRAAMHILRLSWNKLFYATQKPSPRRIQLTEAQSSSFYSAYSDIAEGVKAQADELAEASGKYVEVYDAEGDIIYVSQPPKEQATAELERGRQRERPKSRTRDREWAWKPQRGKGAGQALQLADVTPKQRRQIEEMVLSTPGISIRDAAEAVGAKVKPVEMTPNHHSAEHWRDVIMFEKLWEMEDY